MRCAKPPVELTAAEVLEDAEFLADAGVGIYEAARRTGRSTPALEQALRRANRLDVLHLLRAQVPIPVDTAAGRATRYARWAASPTGQVVHRGAEAARQHAADRWHEPTDTFAERAAAIRLGGAA